MKKTSFTISNHTDHPMTIVHEPECFEFELPIKEEVVIETEPVEDSVYLRVYQDEKSRTIIDVMDSKSLYVVYHKGKDAFEEYIG